MAENQEPISYKEFSKRIKEKYPEYKDIDDLVLSQKMVEKYPDYEGTVMFDDVKKKEPTASSATKLPSPNQPISPLQQGANIVGGGVISDISAKAPKGSIKEAALADKKKNESYLGALWNNAVGSLSRLAGGVTRATYQLSGNPVVRMERELLDKAGKAMGKNLLAEREKEITDAVKGVVEKGRTSASSKEYERKIAEGFDVTDGLGFSDLKGAVAMIPQFAADMGLAIGTGGSSFAIQGYDDALSMVDEIDEGRNMSEGTRVAFGLGGAVIFSVLDKLGLDNLVKTPAAKKYVTAKVIKEATEELAKKGAKVTAEQFENTVKEKASKLTRKELTKIVAKRGVKGAGVEGVTEAAQEGGIDLLKIAANKLEGSQIFNEEEIKNTAAKRYINSFAAGGILGGGGATVAARFQNTEAAIKSKLAKAQTVEDIDAIVGEINENVADGSMTQEEAAEVLPIVENFVEVSQKVPADLNGKNKVQAVDLINEREKLGEQLKEIEAQKAAIDPSFHPLYDGDAEQIQERVNEINKELGELAKPENNIIEAAQPQEEVVVEEEIEQHKVKGTEPEISQPIELSPELPIEEVVVENIEAPAKENKKGVKNVALADLSSRAFAVGMTVEKFDDLKSKIEEKGFVQPIIIDKESGNVLDGQRRLAVAESMGLKEVPAIYMNNPTRDDLNKKIKSLEKEYIGQPVKEQKVSKLDKDNKQPFTTKSKRQVVTFENGDLIVRDSKTNKEVSKDTKKKALAEYAESFDFTVGETAPEPSPDMQFKDENELNQYIVENSQNPNELAKVYAKEEPTTQPLSTAERMIADYGIGKVTNKSFERFGDRNYKGLSMAKTYFNNKEGQGIDQVAKEMSDHYGVEITPQDIADFMVKFPNGEGSALKLVETEVALNAAAKFKELTGLNLNKEIAEKVIEQEFNKLSKAEQLIAQQDYESATELENAYWSAYEQTNGFTEEGNLDKPKQEEARNGNEQPKAEVGKQPIREAEAKPTKVEDKKEPKKISDKAREQAAKLRSGEANVLPDWLRANLPKGTKKQGADINDVYAKALEVFAETYDKLNDFKKAVDEAFKGISDWFKENNIEIDEEQFKANFEAQLKGEQEKKSIKEKELAEGREVALAHADTELKRAELGLEGRTLREVKKDEQLEAEADEAIKNGYNVKGLMKRILGGDLPTDTEHIILVKYAAGLESKLENLDPSSKEFADVFNEINQVYKASEKGGSELGAAFRARQKRAFKEDSLGEMLVREAEVNMVEELTPAQREEVVKEYEEIKKAKEEWEKKYNELVEQQNQKDAEEEVAKVKKATTPKKKDFTKERQSIKDSIKEKWAKAANDGTLMAIPVPYAKQLAAISPDVAKLMKSYVEEGITELSDIVKNIHNDIKDYVEGVTEKDVRDIIGGVYNEKRTRTELAIAVNDLRQEQKLLLKLEALQNGEVPQTETKKREQNKKLKELRDKIKSIKQDDIDAAREKLNKQKLADKEAKRLEKEANKKSPEQIVLDNVKKRITKQIQELEEKLAKGDYSKEAKKEPIKLDAEALELKDKLIKLKQEREIRLLQQEYANRTKGQKAKDLALEVVNVPRTLMASMDFSAPLRQGIVASVANPKEAGFAFVEMFRQAMSQKRFDRWFYDLRESDVYPVMEEAGLYIADPHDPKLSAKEEMFMNNLAEKIPLIGKMVKGSERAYVSYLNKMRADLFVKGMMAFEADGKTVKNSPELYKSLASFINNSTGRGKMTKVLEDSAPILNSMFFSPRLMASRINMLNPAYYQSLSPEIQKMALKDMGTFVGFGLSILALAALAGADVEEDPRSPNFGKIKIGDTTYDIWGGFQQYAVELTQLIRGETKSATTGQVRKLDGKTFPFKSRGDDLEAFIRGKAAPVPAAVMNLLYGKKVTGQRTDKETEAVGLLSPLMVKDAVEAYKKDGVLGSLAVGVPAAFGIGVQTISALPDNVDEKNPVWKFVRAKKQRIPEPDTEMMKVGEEDRMMEEDEAEKFLELRMKKIEKGLKILLEQGKYIVINEEEVLKKGNDLTPAQLEKEISKISRKATADAKEELFGEKIKSDKQKKAESKARAKNEKIESKIKE